MARSPQYAETSKLRREVVRAIAKVSRDHIAAIIDRLPAGREFELDIKAANRVRKLIDLLQKTREQLRIAKADL